MNLYIHYTFNIKIQAQGGKQSLSDIKSDSLRDLYKSRLRKQCSSVRLKNVIKVEKLFQL